MPTTNEKSEKFKFLDDLSQKCLELHKQLRKEEKKDFFHSLLRGEALHTFENISSRNWENLGENLTVFRCTFYGKPPSLTAIFAHLNSQEI